MGADSSDAAAATVKGAAAPVAVCDDSERRARERNEFFKK